MGRSPLQPDKEGRQEDEQERFEGRSESRRGRHITQSLQRKGDDYVSTYNVHDM